MEHPFSEPLEEMTADELDKRYADLLSRWQTARRMNMDINILRQLDLLLSTVETEKERRSRSEESHGGVVLETDPIQIQSTYPKIQRK